MFAGSIQSGVESIGTSAEPSKDVVLAFPSAFESAPLLVATTLGMDAGSAADVHAVSYESVSATEAKVRVRRVDGPAPWSHDVRLSWVALGPSAEAVEAPSFQRGTLTVGPSPVGLASAFVLFLRAFDAPPTLVVSALRDPSRTDDPPDTFAASVRDVTSRRAIVDLCRLDGEGWAQSLQLGWIAVGEASYDGGVSTMTLGTDFTVA